MRSSDQNSSSSTVSSAKSQMIPSHRRRARHFFGFPGRLTCTVVELLICRIFKTVRLKHLYTWDRG